MNMKPRFLRALLWLYPSTWRAEYGGELETVLSRIPMSLSVLADVLLSAAREQLRSGAVWKICGIGLFAWTSIGIIVNNTSPVPQASYEWYRSLWSVFFFLTGCLTVFRRTGASPSWAALKAARLGFLPELVALIAWMAGIFHPLVTKAAGPYSLLEIRLAFFYTTFPTVPEPHFFILVVYVVVVLVMAALIGFIGGLVGRGILWFVPRRHVC